MTTRTASVPRFLSGYSALCALSLRTPGSARAAILGRVVLYGVFLLVFSRLWAVVLQDGALPGRTAADVLWYLAITEWITLSQPRIFMDIEQEVRTGNVACRLLRPLSYAGTKVAEGLGELAVRLLSLGAAGVGLTYALAGGWPADPRGLWLVLPIGVLAAVLVLLWYVLIGLTAFWLDDVGPGFWVFQKLSFVFGGVVLPLDVYPVWLQDLAHATPFAAAYYGVGCLAFGLEPASALRHVATLLGWLALTAFALHVVRRRAIARLELQGG